MYKLDPVAKPVRSPVVCGVCIPFDLSNLSLSIECLTYDVDVKGVDQKPHSTNEEIKNERTCQHCRCQKFGAGQKSRITKGSVAFLACTECVTDLGYRRELLVFELILTPFKPSIDF